jgi:hypothetical protein
MTWPNGRRLGFLRPTHRARGGAASFGRSRRLGFESLEDRQLLSATSLIHP